MSFTKPFHKKLKYYHNYYVNEIINWYKMHLRIENTNKITLENIKTFVATKTNLLNNSSICLAWLYTEVVYLYLKLLCKPSVLFETIVRLLWSKITIQKQVKNKKCRTKSIGPFKLLFHFFYTSHPFESYRLSAVKPPVFGSQKIGTFQIFQSISTLDRISIYITR